MCAEDVEAVHNLDERNALVLTPPLHSFGALDNDDEIVMFALVVHLGTFSVGTRHCDGKEKVVI